MQRIVWLISLLALFLAAFLTSGCEADVSTTTISQRERRWREQSVHDYQIEVETISKWQRHNFIVTVRNGKVTEATAVCSPSLIPIDDLCDLPPFNAADYTVEGLFNMARREAERATGDRWVAATFDPVYHFPDYISYDHPHLLDEETVGISLTGRFRDAHLLPVTGVFG